VKLHCPYCLGVWFAAFSILERIDVGETIRSAGNSLLSCLSFSILERIDVGETTRRYCSTWWMR